MLQRSTQTNEKLPTDRQIVEVRLGNGEWQPATYRDGEFVDGFGMPLDRSSVSSWRPTNAAVNHAAVNHA